jgi:hypothetical protein
VSRRLAYWRVYSHHQAWFRNWILLTLLYPESPSLDFVTHAFPVCLSVACLPKIRRVTIEFHDSKFGIQALDARTHRQQTAKWTMSVSAFRCGGIAGRSFETLLLECCRHENKMLEIKTKPHICSECISDNYVIIFYGLQINIGTTFHNGAVWKSAVSARVLCKI